MVAVVVVDAMVLLMFLWVGGGSGIDGVVGLMVELMMEMGIAVVVLVVVVVVEL